MKKILVVVDMQKDFIDGSLGTKEAVAIVDNVVNLVNKTEWDEVLFTYDTHTDKYSETLEGKMLPVEHCIKYTDGWKINEKVFDAISKHNNNSYYIKYTFGSIELMNSPLINEGDEITFCGLCTDICVISNALMLRAKYPNNIINVVENCCAGVTPEKHNAAIEVMRSCQINVI